jgi:hypothetical protein
MRGLVAVAAREIRERRIMFLAALCFGLLPVVVPRLPWLRAQMSTAEHVQVAVVTGTLIAIAFAFALGSSIVARDIGERRLGFYFARPVAAFSIWAGKILAACLMVVLGNALAMLPGVLTSGLGGGGGAPPHQSHATPFGITPTALLLWGTSWLFCLALASAVAGAFRARSGLLIVDVMAFPAVLAAIALITLKLFDAGAEAIFNLRMSRIPWPWLIVSVMTPVLLAASAAQVVSGRSDPRRGHVALSAVVWGALGVAVAAYFLYAQWLLAATPLDLVSKHVEAPPTGRRFLVAGEAVKRLLFYPSFLVGDDGATIARLPRTTGWAFSGDGKKAVGIDPFKSEIVTVWLDGASAISRVPATDVDARAVALSPDGNRLLVSGRVSRNAGAAVLDVATGRELGVLRVPAPIRGFFHSADAVRLYTPPMLLPGQTAEVRVDELNVKTGATRTVARVLFEAWAAGARPWLHFSPDHSRMLLRHGRGLELLAEDGQPMAVLSRVKAVDYRFLADGRIALSEFERGEQGGAGARLRILDRDGTELRSTSIDARTWGGATIFGESHPGQLIVGLRPALTFNAAHSAGYISRAPWESVFVDAASGEIVRREVGLEPVRLGFLERESDPLPGSLGTRLFWTPERRDLVWFDPRSGERRTLIAGMLPERQRRPQ